MEIMLHYLMISASVVSSGTLKGPRPGFLILPMGIALKISQVAVEAR